MGLALSAAPLIDTSPDRAKTDLNPGLKQIGTLKPRRADEISGSNWTLGCETLDRDKNVEALKATLARYSTQATMRQGENGCPSEKATTFALSNHPWTEFSQAKWDLRRMLGDLGHDVESAVFTICDFNHTGREINRKGLLRATGDKKVEKIKLQRHSPLRRAGAARREGTGASVVCDIFDIVVAKDSGRESPVRGALRLQRRRSMCAILALEFI